MLLLQQINTTIEYALVLFSKTSSLGLLRVICALQNKGTYSFINNLEIQIHVQQLATVKHVGKTFLLNSQFVINQ